ncbi:MAG TPA: fused MFS/spermidine synthase [Anaeromyxobacter sp.]
MSHPRHRAAAVSALFFVSGAAGLVYQVVWSRLLNEVFGVTAYAVTAVLATFLAGLAAGGWVLGRAADRSASPLRLYAQLEAGIALLALTGSWVVHAVDPVHVWAATRFAPDSVALLVSRCALAALVVVPPTFLMGGTLPALTRVVVGETEHVGRQLGLIYAVNTAGAVVGSALSGFVLIRALGLHGTLYVAVACNVAVALAALGLAWRTRPSPAARPAAAAAPGGPAVLARTSAADVWLLVTMALSGVASLALEVIWTRMLVLVLGTSTYAFVTMLSAFLVGITAGSFIARGVADRLGNPRRTFGWVQAGIAAATLATVPLLRTVLDLGTAWLENPELGWFQAMAARFGVSFAVMIVPTTLIGTTLPLAMRIAARDVGSLGTRLGVLYGSNAAGNIVGAVVGGFVLLPLLGMQRSVAVLAMLNLAAAGWALLPAGDDRWSPRVLLRAAPISAGLWSCILVVALWRPGPLPRTGGGPDDTVAYYREGRSATVKVFQRAYDARQELMAIDGIVIGQSSAGVDKKQQVLAHFPFLLSERPPRTVLTVGLGTGILAGEMARHPGVERITVVEIARGVIEGARAFEHWNAGVLHDPRVQIVEDDGVNYLRRARRSYDAIVSDGKSKSGHAGNAVFFSQDYYRSARDHLAVDGAMLQWVPLDLPPEDLRTIVRTFASVFPHVYLWIAQESSFLVGRLQPLSLDLDRVQRGLDEPATADLRRYGWERADDVAALLVADETTLAPWLGADAPVNSLETPILEFYAPGGLAEPEPQRVAANLESLVGLRRRAEPLALRAARSTVDGAFDAVARLVDGAAALAIGERRGVALIEGALAAAPRDGVVHHWGAEALFGFAQNLDLRGRAGEAVALYQEALRAWPGLVEADLNLGRDLAMEGRQDEAIAFLRKALQLNPEAGLAHRELSELLLSRGETAPAVEEGRAAVELAPSSAEAHGALGLAEALAGDAERAIPELLEASRLRPGWPAPLARAALLLGTRPTATPADKARAIELARRAAGLAGPADPMTLETLAAVHAAAARFDEAVAFEQRALDATGPGGDAPSLAAMRAVLESYRRHEPTLLPR